MNSKHKEIIKHACENLLYNYYIDCKELSTDKPSAIKDRYYTLCDDLQRLIPVQVVGKENLILSDNTIIAANHIQTPYIFEITNLDKLEKMGIKEEDMPFFPHRKLRPNEVRQYVLVNLAREINRNPRIVSFKKSQSMNKIFKNSGFILIPKDSTHRTDYLIESIKDLSANDTPIIFPEGRDSEGYLEYNEYYLMRFRKGTAVISKTLNIPIQPISLVFDTQSMSYTVVISPRIEKQKISDLSAEELIQHVQDVIIQGIKTEKPKALVQINEHSIFDYL